MDTFPDDFKAEEIINRITQRQQSLHLDEKRELRKKIFDAATSAKTLEVDINVSSFSRAVLIRNQWSRYIVDWATSSPGFTCWT